MRFVIQRVEIGASTREDCDKIAASGYNLR